MKTSFQFLFSVTLLSSFAFAIATTTYAGHGEEPPGENHPPAALEVHEWGTFTVLQGSDGQVIEWYQAADQLVDLPPFVRRSIRIAGKSGARFGRLDTVRMETPVLYFYPDKEMDVTVSASFPNGRITEVFPPAATSALNKETVWHGTLLPPGSPERKKIPAATGPGGRHYAAAREVPEAWLFRNKALPAKPTSTLPDSDDSTPPAKHEPGEKNNPDPTEPIEHFIFYRGAGQHQMYELRAVQGEGPHEFILRNHGTTTIPKVFAIQVVDGQTSWMEVDSLDVVDHVDGETLNEKHLSFPKTSGKADHVAADLRVAMINSLHAEGLTPAEATAMVNTWDNLWFTEPGTRFLAVLPQQFADEMVPLTITPIPKKIARVFVARVEIITREKEQILTSLLKPGDTGENLLPAAAQLADLQLGRYSAGGMERALALLERQMRHRFARLSQTANDIENSSSKNSFAE